MLQLVDNEYIFDNWAQKGAQTWTPQFLILGRLSLQILLSADDLSNYRNLQSNFTNLDIEYNQS